MKDYIEERAIEIAEYIIEHEATVRQAAKKFGVSKSTVHKDITERLSQIQPQLAARARCKQIGASYSRRIGNQRKISAPEIACVTKRFL